MHSFFSWRQTRWALGVHLKQLLNFLWEATKKAKESSLCNPTVKVVMKVTGVPQRNHNLVKWKSPTCTSVIVWKCIPTCCLNNVDGTWGFMMAAALQTPWWVPLFKKCFQHAAWEARLLGTHNNSLTLLGHSNTKTLVWSLQHGKWRWHCVKVCVI